MKKFKTMLFTFHHFIGKTLDGSEPAIFMRDNLYDRRFDGTRKIAVLTDLLPQEGDILQGYGEIESVEIEEVKGKYRTVGNPNFYAVCRISTMKK